MRISVLATAFLALATTAHAADMPARMYTKAPPAPVMFSWTGLYLGAHGGYGWSSNDGSVNGGFGGGQIGANYQTGNVVFGLEADVSGGSLSDSVSATVGPVTGTASTKVDAFGTARGRVGYAIDNALIYGTGGFAWAHNKFSVSVPGFSGSDDKTHTGWTLGGGVEYAFRPNWSAKVEYLYADYGSENYSVAGASFPSGRLQVNTVKVGVNYRFY